MRLVSVNTSASTPWSSARAGTPGERRHGALRAPSTESAGTAAADSTGAHRTNGLFGVTVGSALARSPWLADITDDGHERVGRLHRDDVADAGQLDVARRGDELREPHPVAD